MGKSVYVRVPFAHVVLIRSGQNVCVPRHHSFVIAVPPACFAGCNPSIMARRGQSLPVLDSMAKDFAAPPKGVCAFSCIAM